MAKSTESKKDEKINEPKQEVKTSDEDVTSLIEKAVKEATEKLEAKYESKISEIKAEYEQENELENNKNIYKYIPDNTKIRLKSNIGGLFTFNEDRGKVRSFFQIDNFGKSVNISFEELNLFLSSKPSFIKSGNIAIVDVYSDSNITVEDVIKDLRLDDLYLNENKINPMKIEDLFDDNIVSEKEFERLLNNSLEMAETVMEAGHILYKKGLFTNNNKMNSIRQIFRNPNLFK